MLSMLGANIWEVIINWSRSISTSVRVTIILACVTIALFLLAKTLVTKEDNTKHSIIWWRLILGVVAILLAFFFAFFR